MDFSNFPGLAAYSIMTRLRIFWGLVFFLGCSLPALTQTDQYKFSNIDVNQGLSHNQIKCIFRGSKGFMWFGTISGLNRYDGYTFKVFTNDPYNSNSLSSNTIIKIFEDRKSRIWIGTENAGLNIYNKKTGKFFRLAHLSHDAKTLSGNDIRLIAELTDGRILVSTVTSGLNIVELGDKFFDTGEKAVKIFSKKL